MDIQKILSEVMGWNEQVLITLSPYTTVYRKVPDPDHDESFFLTRQRTNLMTIYTFSFVPAWGNGDRTWYTHTWVNLMSQNADNIVKEILEKIRDLVNFGGEVPFEWPFE